MIKVLAFGASNSKTSINKKLAHYAANKLQNVEVTLADLNNYASPVYSIDLEKENGVDEGAMQFYGLIEACDAIVCSMAEYNGLTTSAFKNLWDWLSRIPTEVPMNIWMGKPMFLLSTSPSRRPESNVFKVTKELFPHFGANIVASFHLPSFNHSFKSGEIVEKEYRKVFEEQLAIFQKHLDTMC